MERTIIEMTNSEESVAVINKIYTTAVNHCIATVELLQVELRLKMRDDYNDNVLSEAIDRLKQLK